MNGPSSHHRDSGKSELPVTRVLGELVRVLEERGTALLEAAPGAGKSTLVPPALLNSALGEKGKIYLLEPRRLAARSLAHFISKELGDRAGGVCGYRVHRESRVSEHTRIEVMTEGVLIRMIQSDPALEEGSVVIFDEFHERSILSDTALSLLLEVKESLRPDLALLFMSATPDCEGLAQLIPGLPLVKSEGRQFPVDVYYRPLESDIRGRAPRPGDATPAALAAVEEALDDTKGDILVFLPGEREINRWQGELSRRLGGRAEILSLYGRMPLEKQNRVISARADGRRRIVLSTDIAETSLTIPGVTAVVDTGLCRRPAYNASSGLTLLETAEISLASAKQRSGRAGRTSPGRCYRLWDVAEERRRDGQTPPEILQADLASLVLELAVWGTTEPGDMMWMTEPPGTAWRAATELLRLLGALDREGRITGKGRAMAGLPVHPRLAALLLYGRDGGLLAQAALTAAFLEGRDFLPYSRGCDMAERFLYLTGRRPAEEWSRPVGAIRDEAVHLAGLLGAGALEFDGRYYDSLVTEGPSLLAQAYPDRLALSLGDGAYQLSGGGRVVLSEGDPLGVNELLVAAHCGGVSQARQRLYLGMGLNKAEAERIFSEAMVNETHGFWEKDKSRVRLVSRKRLGELTFSERPVQSAGPEELASVLAREMRRGGLEILPWDRESRRLFMRMDFAGEQNADWPRLSPEDLADRVGEWLIPFFKGNRLEGGLRQPLLSLLDWGRQKELDRVAPDHYKTALGNRRKIEYGRGEPYLPVPLQEMYGVRESPRLGIRPLVLHLLNPAGRPVQVTADLESFWESAWPSVRSELKGRYPKHYWPEKPAESKPSLSTGKRRPG